MLFSKLIVSVILLDSKLNNMELYFQLKHFETIQTRLGE